jgi:hypothetical protein
MIRLGATFGHTRMKLGVLISQFEFGHNITMMLNNAENCLNLA